MPTTIQGQLEILSMRMRIAEHNKDHKALKRIESQFLNIEHTIFLKEMKQATDHVFGKPSWKPFHNLKTIISKKLVKKS